MVTLLIPLNYTVIGSLGPSEYTSPEAGEAAGGSNIILYFKTRVTKIVKYYLSEFVKRVPKSVQPINKVDLLTARPILKIKSMI